MEPESKRIKIFPEEMSPNTITEKCLTFLSTLIKLAGDQASKTQANNVKKFIQNLIDGTIEPEEFSTQLQKELKSDPQPYLIQFLKKSLPHVRQSLMTNEMSIDGIRPPPLTVAPVPAITTPTVPGSRLAGQWQYSEALMKPNGESSNLWQYREDLRRKDDEILRLRQRLERYEEEITRLNECATQLEEELKNAGARNSGTAGESYGNSYASDGYGGDYASDSYGGGYGSWSDGGYGRGNSASDYSGPGQYMGKDAGRNEGWGPDSGGGPMQNTGGYSNRGSGPYGDSRKPVIQSCPVNTVVTNDAHGSTSQWPSTQKQTASDQDGSEDDDKDETSMTGEFVPAGAKKRWKKRFMFPLLQAYAKYKAELTHDPSKDGPVWTKIAHELHKKCGLKTYKADACEWRIGELRKEYERLKTLGHISKGKARLFQEAGYAFEGDASPAVAPSTGPDKWYGCRPIKLLQMYVKHKTQFSRPGVQEHIVWQEIAGELRLKLNMDATGSECRDQLERLRLKYERMKNRAITNEMDANFMDAARPAFESTYCPASIFDERPGSLLSVRKRKEAFRLRLLQVYAKYKHDLSPRSGVPELQVWDRISEEVREYAFDCGTYLCRHEVSLLRDQYESMRTNRPHLNLDMRNLMEEARRAFDD